MKITGGVYRAIRINLGHVLLFVISGTVVLGGWYSLGVSGLSILFEDADWNSESNRIECEGLKLYSDIDSEDWDVGLEAPHYEDLSQRDNVVEFSVYVRELDEEEKEGNSKQNILLESLKMLENTTCIFSGDESLRSAYFKGQKTMGSAFLGEMHEAPKVHNASRVLVFHVTKKQIEHVVKMNLESGLLNGDINEAVRDFDYEYFIENVFFPTSFAHVLLYKKYNIFDGNCEGYIGSIPCHISHYH